MTNKTFEDWWNKYGEFPDNRYMCQEIFEAGQRACAERCIELVIDKARGTDMMIDIGIAIKREFLDG